MPRDKLYHLLAGIGLTAALLPFMTPEQALGITILIALAKEYLYDASGRGHVDMYDALVTAIGGAISYGAYQAIVYLR